MRRLARWLLNTLTALSLLLCVASAMLWVRSDTWFDEFRLTLPTQTYELQSVGGAVFLIRDHLEAYPDGRHFSTMPRVQKTLKVARQPPFAVRIVHARTWVALQVGYFWLVAVSLALPACRIIAAARRRRSVRRDGQCLTCGYDLTGNLSGVCPECGTAVRGNSSQTGSGPVARTDTDPT